jgi:hypothetical protein
LLSPILSLSHSFHLGGPIKTDIKARIAFWRPQVPFVINSWSGRPKLVFESTAKLDSKKVNNYKEKKKKMG